ncbi:MAG: rhodanese-like domain-containing protein [Pleurocapsa minor GSE-CHR-MK-17-07R]|jgi:rhodanese-related sulfurtransferase|nr:rhodanese-like domain-containing protein [Pleurocapsa minor GSE-CHR-MK 17-07R]
MNFFKSLFGSNSNALNPADAKARIDEKRPLLILDVRQPDEFRDGHIPGAKLIPLGELANRLGELPRETEILCVCRSGSRSSAAAGQLARAGLNALNLRGGMMSWQMAGYPVKKGK